MYPFMLLAVSSCLWFGCMSGIRFWVLPTPPPDATEPEIPWWWWPIGGVVVLALFVGGAVALGYVLDVAEAVWMRRAKCETCGARSWSEEDDAGPTGWGL